MTQEELEYQIRALDEQIEALKAQKRVLVQELDRVLTNNAIKGKLGDLSDSERAALAQIIGALPAEGVGE